MNSKKITQKTYALRRIYPDLLKKDPKKILGRLAIIYLGFVEPIIEVLLIPWELYNGTKPKNFKDPITFFDTYFSAQVADQFIAYKYADLKDLKIYFTSQPNDFHEKDSILSNSNIHFELEETTNQFYFDNRDTELIKLLKFLYENDIKFKEYRDGRRTFLLKQPGYKELQEIKMQYNIEW